MDTIFVRRRPDSVMEWVYEDVHDWLCQLGLEKYSKRFYNHSVSGPVLLELDEVLLDDLQISSLEDRRSLLAECSRLCAQELELVTRESRDTSSRPSVHVPSIHVTFENNANDASRGDHETRESEPWAERNLGHSIENCASGSHDSGDDDLSEVDDVASRATLMVTMLSQENTSLRQEIEELKLQLVELIQVKEEIRKLQTVNNDLDKTIEDLKSQNRESSKEIEELRKANLEMHDIYRERGKLENEIKQALEDEIKVLTQENKTLRRKLANNKRNTNNHKVENSEKNGKWLSKQEDSMQTSRNSPRNGLISQISDTGIPYQSLAPKSGLSEKKNSYLISGELSNGHPINGDLINGELNNGHSINGELNNGHSINGHLINGELSNLRLIDEIYRANKRCAELENTIRLMHSELYKSDGSLGNQLMFSSQEGEGEDGPAAPEWPSFLTSSPRKDNYEHSKHDQECLEMIHRNGLPTDSDDDMWSKDTSNATPKLSRTEDPDNFLLHLWNV